ncbi:hypothetical protein DSO57_1006918 [Entomophthora muscae]|uniref:Uncharacterized protein n=1 Tax=Entomophthora muscae TaxID=34485 RepID=A0ACC2U5Z8_9FUNG|nr:hypothetical protein DSO57_1006918 [Entomophthora muscae]
MCPCSGRHFKQPSQFYTGWCPGGFSLQDGSQTYLVWLLSLTEGSTQEDVIMHSVDARILVVKVLEEFSGLQSQYNTLASELRYLTIDALIQLAPHFGTGHVWMSSEEQQEYHAKCETSS